jgi:transcriptional regulator with XRE-family HTH domain
MEVYEKVNQIIKNKGLSKRQFASVLQNLEPKLKSTGETPSEKTVYKYLNGDINIPIELISYIAEALDISEQELFDTNFHTKIKLYKYLMKTLKSNEIQVINNIHTNFNLIQQMQPELILTQENVTQLLELLPYAPKPMLEEFIKKLKRVKKITSEDLI